MSTNFLMNTNFIFIMNFIILFAKAGIFVYLIFILPKKISQLINKVEAIEQHLAEIKDKMD